MKKDNNYEIDIQTLQNFIVFLSSVAIYSAVHHYKIHKDFNNKKEIKILTPEKINSVLKKRDKKRILSQPLGKDILKFKSVLIENINNEDFNFLFNNLKTLKTNERIFFLRYFLLQFIGGTYNSKKNKVKILKFIKNDVLNHELFHMASSMYDKEKNITFSGFMQVNYKTKKYIGNGLNEGYTQLLAERYFGETNRVAHSYKICMFFAEKLEEIIGKEKMQSLYLNADLLQLINELKRYDTEENIINFIKSLDLILKYVKYMYNPLRNIPTYKFYVSEKNKDLLEFIQSKLIEWYTKKKELELENNLINDQQFLKDIAKYYFSINENKLLLDKNIKTIDYEKVKKFLLFNERIKKNTK